MARAIKKGNKWIAMIYENPKYLAFKQSMAAKFACIEPIKGYVDLQVTVVAANRADTGNIDKPVGDALELAGVLEDDKFIRNIIYYRHYHPNSGSKNKYDDAIMVELTKVPESDMEIILGQQQMDAFELRRKL